MTTSEQIQFGALLVALASLVVQQTRLINERRRQERRIETKLRLFYLLQDAERRRYPALGALIREQVERRFSARSRSWKPELEGVQGTFINRSAYIPRFSAA
jgi:hypothetical protein